MTIPAALDLLLELPSQASSSSGSKTFSLPRLVGHLAYHAMMLEVHLTPKPVWWIPPIMARTAIWISTLLSPAPRRSRLICTLLSVLVGRVREIRQLSY